MRDSFSRSASGRVDCVCMSGSFLSDVTEACSRHITNDMIVRYRLVQFSDRYDIGIGMDIDGMKLMLTGLLTGCDDELSGGGVKSRSESWKFFQAMTEGQDELISDLTIR
ncbi:hypothetical protein HAX54_029802 [Datura stramonium]|uniref:Uncharacterized protein n=1 Tax=Datura stramonium TaxID=4076 RepID=A0ABS8V9B5_DATST|nr:hypothetical protein [Datura stramonium]